jgi:hypothetical protein
MADQNLIGSQINKKVNTNMIQNIKFMDNKKRGRAGPTPQFMGGSHNAGMVGGAGPNMK